MKVPNGFGVWELAVTRRGPNSAHIGVKGMTSTDLGLLGRGERFLSPFGQKEEAIEKKAPFSTQKEYSPEYLPTSRSMYD